MVARSLNLSCGKSKTFCQKLSDRKGLSDRRLLTETNFGEKPRIAVIRITGKNNRGETFWQKVLSYTWWYILGKKQLSKDSFLDKSFIIISQPCWHGLWLSVPHLVQGTVVIASQRTAKKITESSESFSPSQKIYFNIQKIITHRGYWMGCMRNNCSLSLLTT
jgi:hypothetical protein